MSKQLAVASAFSVLALSALALFAPAAATREGPAIRIAGPAFELPTPHALFD